MARVDFYILADTGPDAREQFACRLAAKASKLDNRVHILHHSNDQLAAVDTLLWTFNEASFVAHDIWPADQVIAGITLGLAADGLPDDTTVCINLTPDPVTGCDRVAEIVAGDETAKTQSRRVYGEYRELGAELNTHKL